MEEEQELEEGEQDLEEATQELEEPVRAQGPVRAAGF